MKAECSVAVSLNGVDNVGKTTQLAWLRRGLPDAHLVGTVDAWHPRWQELAAGSFADWWFVSSSTREHVQLLLDSHIRRRAGSDEFALEDRGSPMLRATCAATVVIKDGLAPFDALQRVDEIAASLPAATPRREVHVLLRRFGDPRREAEEALRREPCAAGERYTAYQHALATILARQVEGGEYDAVLDIGDAPILDVQRQLRAYLKKAGFDVQPLPQDVVDRVWVLGGLSESGKSTVGELLRDEHGVTRLKIGYLLDVAALRAGVDDPYREWSEQEQAERLTEELLRFTETTKAAVVSLESAHRFDATAHLKRIWGDRCRIVYLDVDSSVRASRTAEAEAGVRTRDETKLDRGAGRVRDIADHMLDNSHPLSALKLTLNRIVCTTDLQRSSTPTTTPDTHRSWLRAATRHLVDQHVALVLATGSTGTEAWRDRWSDLDLLVVRDTVPISWLRDVAAAVPRPNGTKLGISTFTTADIDALRVPPRVLRSLMRASAGVGVLHRRADYWFPVPSAAQTDRSSRGEMGLVLMTLRRLLADKQVAVRSVHKHLVLLTKILLRADGIDLDDADTVLSAFRDTHPRADFTPPTVDQLIARPHDPDLHAELLHAAEHLLGYINELDHTMRAER